MYCIECGVLIPVNSKFCSNCGKQQNENKSTTSEKVVEINNENEIFRQVVEEQKSSLDYQFLRKSIGWYMAWVLIHLGLLLICSNGIFDRNNMGRESFWPFGYREYQWSSDYNLELSRYDITEFLVYTIFPLAILIIWSMIRSHNKDEKNA